MQTFLSSTHDANCPYFALCIAANQERMADEGGIEMLVTMLDSPHPHLQRQSAKALANLGVNAGNKDKICKAGGVPLLVRLAGAKNPNIAVEAVAALGNLAVNGESSGGRWLDRNRWESSITRLPPPGHDNRT